MRARHRHTSRDTHVTDREVCTHTPYTHRAGKVLGAGVSTDDAQLLQGHVVHLQELTAHKPRPAWRAGIFQDGLQQGSLQAEQATAGLGSGGSIGVRCGGRSVGFHGLELGGGGVVVAW